MEIHEDVAKIQLYCLLLLVIPVHGKSYHMPCAKKVSLLQFLRAYDALQKSTYRFELLATPLMVLTQT